MAHFQHSDADSLDRRAYLVGTPITHSLSPLLHHSLYSAISQNWGQLLYDTHDLKAFMEMLRLDQKCMGSGCTMPFKLEVIPYLDELSAEGEAIGAVNTIWFKTDAEGRRKFCGTNTDCIGVRDAFLTNVKDPSMFRGRPGLVVGGGGTCRAAVYALQTFLGCSPVYIINRDKSEVDAVIDECKARGFGEDLIHVSTVAQAQQMQAPGAVVSAVPDFPPATEGEKTAREILTVLLSKTEKGALLEMCYHPSPNTEISKLAKTLGWSVIMGTEAMIGQGFEQARLWTGIEITDEMREEARRCIREAISERHKL
jgi:quinate dehydrogenase